MTQASLMTSGAHVATRDEIANLPDPEARGRFHNPLRHDVVLDAITGEVDRRGYGVAEEELALANNGGMMLGIMKLMNGTLHTFGTDDSTHEGSVALGFRYSTNQKTALRAVAGASIFVCDNMVLSGETFVMCRKSTTKIDLAVTVRVGFDRFLEEEDRLSKGLVRLQATELSEQRAKVLIYDAILEKEVVAPKLIRSVNDNYFSEDDEIAPRTLWGLHNAFSRAIRSDVSSPVAQMRQTEKLGAYFGI